MHRPSVWLTAGFVVSLSVACSARGGGGNIGPLDAGSGDDSTVAPVDNGAPDDTTLAPDLGVAPIDNGVAPIDTGKTPVDTGLVVDNGPPPACGDARCNGTETCMTCRDDCGPCAATCGDGTCNSGETCTSCPTDCGPCPAVCGDGECNGSESCTSCSRDCGPCPPRCGDGTCNGSDTCSNCPADCGPCPANCAAVGSCAACTTNPACGWCSAAGACEAGNASGPTGTSVCTIFGGWVRSATSCPAPDSGVRDAGVDSGPADITAPCVGSSTMLTAQCGWILGRTISCTSGTSVRVGCTPPAGDAGAGVTPCLTPLGSSSGDPMMRVCPGNGPCATGLTISGSGTSPADDGCGLGPLGRFTCPSAGLVTVYWRAYDYANRATVRCTLGTGG